MKFYLYILRQMLGAGKIAKQNNTYNDNGMW